MAQLICLALTSLDGYVEDADGKFECRLVDLELLDERRFADGSIYVRYRVRS